MATIDDLINDWQERANNNPKEQEYYIGKFKELIDYLINPKIGIIPYRMSNGKMTYRLKVLENDRRTRR